MNSRQLQATWFGKTAQLSKKQILLKLKSMAGYNGGETYPPAIIENFNEADHKVFLKKQLAGVKRSFKAPEVEVSMQAEGYVKEITDAGISFTTDDTAGMWIGVYYGRLVDIQYSKWKNIDNDWTMTRGRWEKVDPSEMLYFPKSNVGILYPEYNSKYDVSDSKSLCQKLGIPFEKGTVIRSVSKIPKNATVYADSFEIRGEYEVEGVIGWKRLSNLSEDALTDILTAVDPGTRKQIEDAEELQRQEEARRRQERLIQKEKLESTANRLQQMLPEIDKEIARLQFRLEKHGNTWSELANLRIYDNDSFSDYEPEAGRFDPYTQPTVKKTQEDIKTKDGKTFKEGRNDLLEVLGAKIAEIREHVEYYQKLKDKTLKDIQGTLAQIKSL